VIKKLLIGLLRLYRCLSPLRVFLPAPPLAGRCCRFHPSCSCYAEQAIQKLGPTRGLWLTFKRLARCHPFHPGGFDPVPEK